MTCCHNNINLQLIYLLVASVTNLCLCNIAGRSIDKCGGYASRDGIYKYHVAPTCLLQQLR